MSVCLEQSEIPKQALIHGLPMTCSISEYMQDAEDLGENRQKVDGDNPQDTNGEKT